MASETPLIDAHIHLWPSTCPGVHNWMTEDSPFNKQFSIDQFKKTTEGKEVPFIWMEADAKYDLAAGEKDGSGWEGPLDEVSFVKRIITGQPAEGDGFAAEDAPLCKAYIPWAPLASGAVVMEKYIEAVKGAAGDSWHKVKGFRYLLQDKPHGTALEDKFIESLQLLGRLGLVFDVGIDQHRRGRKQLEEVVEMIDRAHDGVPENEKVVFVLDHMCKPDLEVYTPQTSTGFVAWRTAMFTLSKCDNTYMKLSGGFPEMSRSLRNRSVEDIFDATSPWLSVLVAAFGPSRLMFASDWPPCTSEVVEENGTAWSKWHKVVERLCYMASLEDEEKRMIWSGTAIKAFNIAEFSLL